MTVLHTDRSIPLALNSTDTTFSTGLNLGWDFTADDASHKDGVPWLYVGATSPTLVKSGTQTLSSAGPEPGVAAQAGAIYDYTNATNYGWQDGTGDFLTIVRWSTPSTLPSSFTSRELLRVSGSAGIALTVRVNEDSGVGWYSTVGGAVMQGTSATVSRWPANRVIVTLVQRVSGVVSVYDLDVTNQGNLITRYNSASATTSLDATWTDRTIANFSSGTVITPTLNSIWHWNKPFNSTDLLILARDMYRAQANSAVADSLTITSPTAGGTINATSVISGTYTGTQPAGIEVQHGSGSWVLGTSATIGGGNWTATFTLTPGAANALKARESQAASIVSPSISNITVNSNSITFTRPSFTESATAYRIYQRNSSNQASVRVSGTYVGTPTSLEYRWNGGAWAPLGGTMSGGSFNNTLTLTGPAQGDLQVRFANDTSVFQTLVAVGVGDVWLCPGQSNHVGGGTGINYVPPVAPGAHPGWVGCICDLTGTWRPNFETSTDPFHKATEATGFPDASELYPGVFSNGGAATYFGALATRLMALGIPTAFVPCAKGSTDINVWMVGSSTFNTLVDRATQIGGHKGVIWWQGEGDAAINTPRSTFETKLNGIVTQWGTTFPGCKWVLMNLNAAGNGTGNGGTGPSDTGFNAIHAAIANVAATNANAAAIADTNGLFAQLHYTTAGEINAIADVAYSAIANSFYAKHANVTLVDRNGSPRASLTGLKWAFFDQATPHTLTAPVDKGNAGTTDASGNFSAPLLSTALSVGGVGLLVISDTDGTASQSPSSKAFCAPVEVS